MASVTNTKYAQQAWQFSLSIGTWLVCKYADVTTVHKHVDFDTRIVVHACTVPACYNAQLPSDACTDCQCHLVVTTVWLPVFMLSVYAEE